MVSPAVMVTISTVKLVKENRSVSNVSVYLCASLDFDFNFDCHSQKRSGQCLTCMTMSE